MEKRQGMSDGKRQGMSDGKETHTEREKTE